MQFNFQNPKERWPARPFKCTHLQPDLLSSVSHWHSKLQWPTPASTASLQYRLDAICR